MYLLNPATALDLARFRIEHDLAGAERRRRAREAKAALREAEPAAPRHRAPAHAGRHRSTRLVGVLSARLGH
jgi:hypothetical protein